MTNLLSKLDLKDRRILDILCENCRYSNALIGKTIGLSKDAVAYRINRLVDNNAIQQFITNINYYSLGYDFYYLVLQLQIVNKENPYVINVLKASGKWDYQVSVIAKNNFQFEQIENQLLQDLGELVKQHESHAFTQDLKWSPYFKDIDLKTKIFVKKDKFFQKYFLNASKLLSLRKIKNIDKTDKKILKEICKNPRIELSKVAKKVKLTREAVDYRIKNLIKKGVVLQFSIFPDYLELGFLMNTFFVKLKNFTKQNEKKVKHFLSSRNYIIGSLKMTGKWNLLFYTLSKDHKEFHKHIIDIRNSFGEDLIEFDTTLILDWPYYNSFPKCLQK